MPLKKIVCLNCGIHFRIDISCRFLINTWRSITLLRSEKGFA